MSLISKHSRRIGFSVGTGGDHFANFIDCVRSRNKEDLHAPIEEGHISCALIHLANVSYRLGRAIRYRPETQEINGDEEAMRLMRGADRGYRDPYASSLKRYKSQLGFKRQRWSRESPSRPFYYGIRAMVAAADGRRRQFVSRPMRSPNRAPFPATHAS